MKIAREIWFAPIAALLFCGAQAPESEEQEIPEEIRRQLPPGARISGPPLTYGIVIYDGPRMLDPPREGSVLLRRDVVVAEQRAEVSESRLISDVPVVIGEPFNETHPAGSYFALVRVDDETQPCLQNVPHQPFTPAEDEHGNIFPGTCLIDEEGDGRYETALLLPYHPDRVQARRLGIDPVRLMPPPAVEDPRLPRHLAIRRIRVAQLTEASVTFALEHGFQFSRREPSFSPPDRSDRASLLLEVGRHVSLGGINLTIEGGPGEWRVAVQGAFPDWLSLERDGTELRMDRHHIRQRGF